MTTLAANRFAEFVASALERMAFVITEPSDAPPDDIVPGCCSHSTIEVRGKVRHELCVSATAGLVREVASGMLGIEADDVDLAGFARSTVTELANVLGGELVMMLADDEAKLGLPDEIGAVEAAHLCAQAEDSGFRLVVGSETGKLVVAVRHD